MPARKRARQEVEPDERPPPQELTKLEKLRSLWEFASLTQYIYIFGSVVKIDEDIDVDELESECLKPTPSEKLAQIGLALLKFVSSHKGLTLEIFDEYARRQFVAKAPQRNPFGVEEEPKKFNDMDTFAKIRILHQLSTWTLNNADRIREKMPEQKDVEQTNWRVEPFGWDKEDRTYFVLDDDRLYRRTDPPLPAAPPSKAKSKPKAKKTRGTRASKRRRLSTTPPESAAEEEEDAAQDAVAQEEDTFGGMKWECVAITLEDYRSFMESIRRSRDPNEKELVKRLEADVVPIIEKRAEQQRQKALKKQRELENLEKLANAKRSSRIAGRMEKQREQEAAAEAERKRVADLEMAKKEQDKQQQMEEARQSRMMTREQRLKEREVKRILHEEELKRLEENSKKAESNEARMSERHLKAEMERRQKELERMAQEEESWVFDCAVCGVHGENLDDGSHSIACEKCNVWQHSACHGIAKQQAERDDFHFVCSDCKRKEEEAARPKLPPLKFRVGTSASPKPTASTSPAGAAPPQDRPRPPAVASYPHQHVQTGPPSANGLLNGPSLSPQGQSSGPPGMHRPGSSYVSSAHSTPSHVPYLPAPQMQPVNGPSAIPPPRFTPNHPSGHPVMAGSPQWHHSPYSHGQQFHAQSNGYPNSSVMSSPNRPLTYNPARSPYEQQRPPSSGYGAQSPSKPSGSFDQQRPMSSGYGAASPSKPAPSMSPFQANGYPTTAPFSSSNPSFPPVHTRRPSFSPIKQASSPPQQAPAPVQVAQQTQPSQPFIDGTSDLLPAASAGISPEKHDNAPPTPSQSVSEPPVLPPVAPLAPSANPPILTPPSKKTPENSQGDPMSHPAPSAVTNASPSKPQAAPAVHPTAPIGPFTGQSSTSAPGAPSGDP